MSSIDSAISSVLAAQDAALRSKIDFAIEAKRLDAQEQQGAAINRLIESAAQLGKAAGKGDGFDGVA